MLTPTLVDRITRLIEVQILERRAAFPKETARIDSEHNARGMFHSSSRVFAHQHAHTHELEIRAMLAWQNIVRAHRTIGSPKAPALRADLHELIRTQIEAFRLELQGSLNSRLRNAGINSTIPTLNEAASLLDQKHAIEVDLYVDSLDQTDEIGKTMATAPTYNFYGNVGAVQTGANAAANVVQNLGSDERAAIDAALRQVLEEVRTSQQFHEQQRGEIVQIVEECQSQLRDKSPNNTKLMAMFNVLAGSIQAISSAQPAYQSLRLALLPLGITLP